jgi:peptidoglycan/LPS O-acetylase OafA/YrhL
MRNYFTSYYSIEKHRDLRLDFIRGLAMAIVVINHLPVPSLYYVFSLERIGVITGAEPFVLLSGLVLGFAHRKYISSHDWSHSAKKLLKRARLLYLCVLIVSIVAWVLAQVAQSFQILVTWTDSSGTLFQLYPADTLIHPHKLLINILFIKSTPWQFNIIGLYVILIIITPLALWMLARGKRMWLLMISLGLYLIAFIFRIRISTFAFEKSFPLLIWQFLFIGALIAGYYYHNLSAWVNTKQGLLVRRIILILFFLFLFFTWNNYWIHGSHEYVPTLGIIKPKYFDLIYMNFFMERTWLGAGRLLNSFVVVAALCEFLNVAWPFLKKWVGWWTIPIGQASLYIFILHLAVIPLVYALSGYLKGHLLYSTLVHTLVLFILWICVRTRFLFSIIPR